MSTERTVNVGFACNDQNGGFTDKAEQVDITAGGDILIQLEPPDFGGSIEFEIGGFLHDIYVGSEKFDIRGYRAYVGNLCWDAANMTLDEAAHLLEFLRARRWQLMEAESDLFEAYQAGLPLGEYLERALEGVQHGPHHT